jgi:hypothetical protein
MSAGILQNWYLSKIAKSTTPLEYFLAMQEYMLYQMNVFSFNAREYFQRQ